MKCYPKSICFGCWTCLALELVVGGILIAIMVVGYQYSTSSETSSPSTNGGFCDNVDQNSYFFSACNALGRGTSSTPMNLPKPEVTDASTRHETMTVTPPNKELDRFFDPEEYRNLLKSSSGGFVRFQGFDFLQNDAPMPDSPSPTTPAPVAKALPPVTVSSNTNKSASVTESVNKGNVVQEKGLQGKTICPTGASLFYYCSIFSPKMGQFKELDCGNIVQTNPLKEGIHCCPFEFDFVQTFCNTIKEDPNFMFSFLNSNKRFKLQWETEENRIQMYNDYLKAFQVLSKDHGVNLEFSVLLGQPTSDAGSPGTFEHRKFLNDGSVFCYYYDPSKNTGQAKSSPCPKEIADYKLNLNSPNFYNAVDPDRSVFKLKLPTWKEYDESWGL